MSFAFARWQKDQSQQVPMNGNPSVIEIISVWTILRRAARVARNMTRKTYSEIKVPVMWLRLGLSLFRREIGDVC